VASEAPIVSDYTEQRLREWASAVHDYAADKVGRGHLFDDVAQERNEAAA